MSIKINNGLMTMASDLDTVTLFGIRNDSDGRVLEIRNEKIKMERMIGMIEKFIFLYYKEI